MDVYFLVLFIHVTGVAALFVSIGLEWAGMRLLHEAETAPEVMKWGAVMAPMRWLGAVAGLVVLASGLTMTSIRWPWDTGWIGTAIVTVILMAVLGMRVTGARFAAFGRGVASGRIPVSSALAEIKSDPAVRISFRTRVALLVGMLLLMTNKPGLLESLLVFIVAIAIGVGSVLLVPSGEPSTAA